MSDTLSFDKGRLRIDRRRREVLLQGRPVKLGGRAFDLLWELASASDQLLGRYALLDRVWPGLVVEENNLHAQVTAVRRVLGRDAVATVPGRGYRLTLAPDDPAPESANPPDLSGDGNPGLPEGATRLHGREAALASLQALLQPAHCVTLVGPTGVGKTALAQTLVRSMAASATSASASDPAPAAVWVDLQPLRDAALLPALVGDALGVATAGAQPLRALVAGLCDRALLLVLDNAEHLLDAVAALVRGLLDGAAGLRLLVTSQVPLHVDGEQVFRLDTLGLPGEADDARAALRHAAVACFVDQLRALDRHFVFDAQVVGPVVRICRRLDGLPLALKLAAARVPLLGLHVVEQRLDQRLRLLAGGPRQPPTRHASLQAALDWSWGLLSADEQAVLGRLSVLQGSFALEWAAALGADDRLDAWSAIEALATLVDRSLVEFAAAPTPRYRLLDSVREYARDQLRQAGLLAATSRQAAALLAGGAGPAPPADPVQLARLYGDGERPDLALQQWLQAAEQAGAAARLVEVEHHLNQALGLLRAQGERGDAQRVQLLVRLGAVTGLTQGLGGPACEAVYREALPLAERLDLTEARFIALFNLQFMHVMRLERAQAAELRQQVQQLAEASGDERLLLQAEHATYSGSLFHGDLPRTIASAEAGYRRYRPMDSAFHCRDFAGHDPGLCAAGHAALALWMAGRLDEADTYLQRLLALRRELTHPPSHIIGSSMALTVLAWRGDLDAALAEGQPMLDLCRRLEVPVWTQCYTVLIGWVQAQQPGPPDQHAPARMADAIERVIATGTHFRMTTYRAFLVETLLRHGQVEAGLQQAARCLQEIEAQGETVAQSTLLAARAGLHERAGQDRQAQADWQQALDVARQQGAGSLALRAATGLGALLARQGQPERALACVDAALLPFHPDWHNPDLARARALCDGLRGSGRDAGPSRLRAV